MCLVYDGFKDLYKVFANGEKLDSGSWSGDNPMEIARCLLFLFYQSRTSNEMNRKGGILFLGQKQGEIGGEFIAREAWSGQLIMMVTIA